MASAGVAKPTCPDTGLSIPECSCPRCLEAMLAEVRPTVLESELKVTRLRPAAPERPVGDRRRAA